MGEFITKKQRREAEILSLYKQGALSQSECGRLLKMSTQTFQKRYTVEVAEVRKLRKEGKIPSTAKIKESRKELLLESYKHGKITQTDCASLLGISLNTFNTHYKAVVEEHSRLKGLS